MVQEQRTARTALPADATEQQLLAIVGQQPLHIDDIRNQVSLPVEQVTAALAMMELKGMVRRWAVCATWRCASWQPVMMLPGLRMKNKVGKKKVRKSDLC